MSDFTSFFADIWRLFQEVNVPVLNISFADLWIGVFVVSISIVILRPLLGIGGSGFAGSIFRGIRGSVKRSGDSGYSKHKSTEYGTKTVQRANSVRVQHSKPPKGFS